MDFFDYTLKYFLRHFTEEEMTEQKSPEFVNILAEAVNSCQAMVEAKRKVAMDMNIKCKLWGDFPEDVEQGKWTNTLILCFSFIRKTLPKFRTSVPFSRWLSN